MTDDEMTDAEMLKEEHAQTMQRFNNVEPESLIDYSDPDYCTFRPERADPVYPFKFLCKVTDAYTVKCNNPWVAVYIPNYISEFACVSSPAFDFWIPVKNHNYQFDTPPQESIEEILIQTRQVPSGISREYISGYTRFVLVKPFTPRRSRLYFSACATVYFEVLKNYDYFASDVFYSKYTREYYQYSNDTNTNKYNPVIEEFTRKVQRPCWAPNFSSDNYKQIYELVKNDA